MAQQRRAAEGSARVHTQFDYPPLSRRGLYGFHFHHGEVGRGSGFIDPSQFSQDLPNMSTVRGGDQFDAYTTWNAYLSSGLDLNRRQVTTAMPAQFAKFVTDTPGIAVRKESVIEGYEVLGLFFNTCDHENGARLQWYRDEEMAARIDARDAGVWNDRNARQVEHFQACPTVSIQNNSIPPEELGPAFLQWLEQTMNDFIEETSRQRKVFLHMKTEYKRAQRPLHRRLARGNIDDDQAPSPTRERPNWLGELSRSARLARG